MTYLEKILNDPNVELWNFDGKIIAKHNLWQVLDEFGQTKIVAALTEEEARAKTKISSFHKNVSMWCEIRVLNCPTKRNR